MSEGEKRIYDVWLDSLWEFAPQKKKQLLQVYGSSKEVYEKGETAIRRGMEGKEPLQGRLRSLSEIREIVADMDRNRIQVVASDDEEFPELLHEIPNSPWLLYVRGDISLLERKAVAVVGARKASEYGKNVAYQLGKRIAQTGTVVVSGMALGVDAWAHRGALDSGNSSTIAVLGCGVDICYPRGNGRLYGDILQKGMLLSEFLPGTRPRPYYFPMRNRLISGLSTATVIVEAGVGSGSLITAELAADQGREVFAVPGDIDRVGSMGTNKLLKDGATALISADDLIQELRLTPVGREGEERGNFFDEMLSNLGEDEKKIIKFLLQQGEVTVDQIAVFTGLPPNKINGLITILEMKGLISTAVGKIFIENFLNN